MSAEHATADEARPVELARLLEHPAIWRGASAARSEVLPTGFDALDECLPGGGWPRSGLIEILSRFGIGELALLLPALAWLTQRPLARWCVWAAPPLEPFAPALVAQGVVLERVLVVRGPLSTEASAREKAAHGLWAFEQALGSGACEMAMAWMEQVRARALRRLQLAAERGKSLGVLFRSPQAARESSHAILRVCLEPAARGVRVTLLKSRGGRRGSIELTLPAVGS
jgi:hypothetical protein